MNNDRPLAYALLRLTLGVNFAGHGFFRLHMGLAQFAQTTLAHLTKSPLPPGLMLDFLYIVPIVEALLGVALIVGIGTRFALGFGALFMTCLTFGVTANQEWDVAGQQLLYSLVFFVLLFLAEYNTFSLDRLFGRR